MSVPSLFRGNLQRSEFIWLTILVGPFFVFLIVFKIAPIFMNLGYSLMKLDLVGGGKFVGIRNYVKLSHDDLFWTALRNTLQYLLYVGPINVVFGFLIALLLNTRLRGRTVGRTAVFLPYVIMVTLVGITWRWILDGTNGVINHYLGMLGFDPIYFLTDARFSMIGIAITSIWWTIGYNAIIYLAALQDIPRDLLEAAELDGARPLQKLWYIVIPLVKPTTFYCVITTVIYSMQMFGQAYVMTSGGPSYSTLSLVQYMYVKAFKEFELGYAATVGTALFAVIGILSVLVSLAFRERGGLAPRFLRAAPAAVARKVPHDR